MSKYKQGHQESTDANQPHIVEGLEKSGFSVDTKHNDIIVGSNYQGNRWIEIKTESPFGKKGKLLKGHIKDSQYELLWNWKGQYNICWTLEQCLMVAKTESLPPDQDLSSLMFKHTYKEWLTESELNRLRYEGIIKDGVPAKDPFDKWQRDLINESIVFVNQIKCECE